MFGFIGKAFKAVGGAIKSSFSKLASGVRSLFGTIVSKAKAFAKAAWSKVKTFAVKAAQLAAIAGLTVLTGGLGLPIILSLAASGFVGSFAGGVVSALLSGKKPQWKSLLKQGALAAALTVTTFAVGSYVAPAVEKATTNAFGRLPANLADDAGRAAADAVTATSQQAVVNAFSGRPIQQGLLATAGRTAFRTGVVARAREAANDAVARAREAATRRLPEGATPPFATPPFVSTPSSGGIMGALGKRIGD